MRLIVLVFVMLTVGIGHAAVYKYINKQGKTAYSDIPVAGAEKVIVPRVMTYTAPVVQQTMQAIKPPSNHVDYQHLRITQPSEQATIRNNQGQLTVTYAIEPSLQEGDRLVLLLDGLAQESMSIEGLVRGAHTLSLEVLNAKNEREISSPEVVFYLQHASRLN